MKPILETIDTRYGTDNLYTFHMAIPYPIGALSGMNYFVPQSSHTDGSLVF